MRRLLDLYWAATKGLDLIPGRMVAFVIGFFIFMIFVLATYSYDHKLSVGYDVASGENQYEWLAADIGRLETELLIAKDQDAKKADRIASTLAPMKAKLKTMQVAHDQYVLEQAQEKANAQAEAKRQEAEIEQAQKKLAARFQKECNDLRDKKIVDLTTNDVEALKTCKTESPYMSQFLDGASK